MFVIECSHSTDIGTVCFLSALTPIEIGKNVRQLDFVATDQVVLLNGVPCPLLNDWQNTELLISNYNTPGTPGSLRPFEAVVYRK